MSAAEYGDLKHVFEYIIRKQHKETKEENKAFREEREALREDLKTLQDSITEIEKIVKGSKLESERMNRELLDRFGSKTNKLTHLISQVP
jgi:predicted nuclease with TOPRIM domain